MQTSIWHQPVTHTWRSLCLSDTAATVLSCLLGCPLALLSCEKWFTLDTGSLNPNSGTLQEQARHGVSHSISDPRRRGWSFVTEQTSGRSCQTYLHAKTHHSFCVSVDCGWWCFAHTKRHLSGGRQGKKKKGVGDYFASWVVCPHLWENSIFTFCN